MMKPTIVRVRDKRHNIPTSHTFVTKEELNDFLDGLDDRHYDVEVLTYQTPTIPCPPPADLISACAEGGDCVGF